MRAIPGNLANFENRSNRKNLKEFEELCKNCIADGLEEIEANGKVYLTIL